MIPKEMVSTSLKKVGRFKESVQTVPIVQNVPTASFLPRDAGEENRACPGLDPGGGVNVLKDWNFIKQ